MIGEWRKDAACARIDPEIMHPGHDRLLIEHAKAVCRPCPVIDACLTEAIERDEKEGVWGGMDPEERAMYVTRLDCSKCGREFQPRRRLQRLCAYCRQVKRQPATCGTRAGYQRHLRIREAPCEPCRAASRAYNLAMVERAHAGRSA